jgi:hypothetical protein
MTGHRIRVRRLRGSWWAFHWHDGLPCGSGFQGPFATPAEAADTGRRHADSDARRAAR